MTSSGMTCAWKSSAHRPITKPNRLKVIAVSSRKTAIHSGCAISYGTNARAVTRIRMPRMIDFVVAAPT
jgi:hypothetical protein